MKQEFPRKKYVVVAARFLKSPGPAEFRRVERLQRVNSFNRLGLKIPPEEPQHDLLCREIGKDEAVLFDWFHPLLKIKNRGRRRRRASDTY